jgi:hypothetical protein
LSLKKIIKSIIGKLTNAASINSILTISDFGEWILTKKAGIIKLRALESKLNNTPVVVIIGTCYGRNQLFASLDGELMMKRLPHDAINDPNNVNQAL